MAIEGSGLDFQLLAELMKSGAEVAEKLGEQAGQEVAKSVEKEKQKRIKLSAKDEQAFISEMQKAFDRVYKKEIEEAKNTSSDNKNKHISVSKTIGDLETIFDFNTRRNADSQIVLQLKQANQQLATFKSSLQDVDKLIQTSFDYRKNKTSSDNPYSGTKIIPALQGLQGWENKQAEAELQEQKVEQEKQAQQQEEERKKQLKKEEDKLQRDLQQHFKNIQQIVSENNGLLKNIGYTPIDYDKLFATKRGERYTKKDIEGISQELQKPLALGQSFKNIIKVNKEIDKIRNLDADNSNIKGFVNLFQDPKLIASIQNYVTSADNVNRLVQNMKNGVDIDNTAKELRNTLTAISKATSQLDPTKLKDSLNLIRSVRNAFEQLENYTVKHQGNKNNKRFDIPEVRIAGADFKSYEGVSAVVEGIKKDYEFDEKSLKSLALKGNRSNKTVTSKVAQQTKKDAQELNKSTEELKAAIDNNKKVQKTAQQEVTSVWQRPKNIDTKYEFVSTDKLIESARGSYDTIKLPTPGDKDSIPILGDNLKRVRQEVRYRIQEAKEVDKDVLKLMHLYLEIQQHADEKPNIQIKGEKIVTPERYDEVLKQYREQFGLKNPQTAQPTIQQTEIAQTAKQVSEDTKKLDEANKKAEEAVTKTEEVQQKAKRTRKKTDTTVAPVIGTPAGATATPQSGATGQGGTTPNVKANVVLSAEQIQQALDNLGAEKPFSVHIGSITANESIDVTALVDKINAVLQTKPVTVYLVDGSDPVDITKLVEKINKTFENTPVTVSVVNGSKTLNVEQLVTGINKTFETNPVSVSSISGSETLKIDSLKTIIENQLAQNAPVITVISAKPDINVSKLIEVINDKLKVDGVNIQNVSGSKDINISKLQDNINKGLKKSATEIKDITGSDKLNVAQLVSAINQKLTQSSIVVSNVSGSKDLNIEKLRKNIEQQLNSQPVQITKIAVNEKLSVKNLKQSIEQGLNEQTISASKLTVDVSKVKNITGIETVANKISTQLKGTPISVEKLVASETLNISKLVESIQNTLNGADLMVTKISADDKLVITDLINQIQAKLDNAELLIKRVGVAENLQVDAKAVVSQIQAIVDEGKFNLKTITQTINVDTGQALNVVNSFQEKVQEAKANLEQAGTVKFTDLSGNLDEIIQKLQTVQDSLKPFTNNGEGSNNYQLPRFVFDEEQNKTIQKYNSYLYTTIQRLNNILNIIGKIPQQKGNKIQIPYISIPNIDDKALQRLDKYEETITRVASAINILADSLKSIKGFEGILRSINRFMPRTQNTKAETTGDTTKNTTDTKTSSETTKEVKAATTKAKSDIEQTFQNIAEATKKAAEQAIKDAEEANMNKVLEEILTGKKAGQAQRILSSNVLGNENKKVIRDALGEYDKIVEKIKNKAYDSEKSAEEWKRAQKILQDAFDSTADTRRADKYVLKLENLSNKIGNLFANNTKVKGTSIGNQLENLATEIKVLKNLDVNAEDVQRVTTEYERLRSLMYETNLSGKGELTKIATTISATFRRVFAGDVFYRLLMKIREVPKIVQEIDTAMTDLRRVTNETSETYDKFLSSAISKSKQLGATVTETIKATSSFGRLGYDLNEASTLAQNALIYKNVGWLDVETATNDLVSAMKAFNITAEDSLKIVDTFNILGNKFALTSADVGTGLKQSASALSVANNSFEESAAMITAITEITQDASSAGNALKTLSLRIRSTKAELTEMGEDAEGAATTTAKLRKQIKGITGVDILKNNNEFKSTYEIMQGIAKVWKDLSDTEQASVLESLAGKVRANQVAALLNNWSQAEKALDESLNSAGTAIKENDVYLKSAEGRLSQLKSTAQELSLDAFNSDELKGFLTLAKELLEIFTKMKSVAVPVIAGAMIAGTNIKNPSEGMGMTLARMITGKSQYSMLKSGGFVNTKEQTFNFDSIAKHMKGYAVNSDAFNERLQEYTSNIQGLDTAQQKQVATTYTAIAQGEKQTLTMERLGVSTAALTAKTIAWNVVQTIANAAVGAFVSFIIQQALVAINKWVMAEEKAAQAAHDSANALKEETDSIDDYKNRINELRDALDNGNLSHEEAYEKRKELISIQDEIIDKYDVEAGKISLVNGELEKQIGLLDEVKSDKYSEYAARNSESIRNAKLATSKQIKNDITYDGDYVGNEKYIDEIFEKYGFRKIRNGADSVIHYQNDTMTTRETIDALTKLVTELDTNKNIKTVATTQKLIDRINKRIDKLNTQKISPELGVWGTTLSDYEQVLKEAAMPEIMGDDTLYGLYTAVEEANEDYIQAVADGDVEAINKAIERASRLQNVSQGVLSEQTTAIQDVFAEVFNAILGNKRENAKYSMSDETKNAFKTQFAGKNSSYLKDLSVNGIYSQDLTDLQNYAEQAGISVEDLIDVLVELGIVEEDFSIKTEKARPFKAIIEDVEEAQKALTAYDNAIVKMQSPDSSTAFLTADELNTLLTYDDTLVESVKKTAKGYEISAAELSASRKKYFDKQREDIQANIDSTQEKIEAYEKTLKELEAKQTAGSNDPDLGTKITNTKNNIAEQQKELAAYRLTLTEMKPVLIDFRESVNTITSRAESLGQSVADMKTQQEEFNHITDKTALSFISNNENWEDFIELQEDGHYHLKETTDDFEALVTESIGYNNVMARLKNQEQELDAQSSRLKNQMLILAKSGKTGSEEFIALQNELKDTETDLADTGKQVKTLEDLIKALMKAFSSSKAVTDFNNQIKDLKYQLDMGEITQAQYNEGYDQYLEELRKNATDEDKDTLRDAEVTARQQKIAQATSEFEKAQKRIDTAYEQGNISLEQKIAQRRALAEQYYGASSEFGNTEESKEKYQDLLNEIYSMEVDSAQKSYDERKKLVERNTEDHIISIDQEIEELKKLNEEYYNPSTGKLGKTRNALDSKIYEENLREIQGKIKEAYDYWTKEDERAKNMG